MNSHEPKQLSLLPLRRIPLADGRPSDGPAASAHCAVGEMAVGEAVVGELSATASAGFRLVPPSKPASARPVAGSARASTAREPLWRHVIGDVLRRERLAQERTLKDVADAARISMPYLSELERGRKEASSEVLAAAARALGLGLADLLVLAQAELARSRGDGGLVPARVPIPSRGPITGPIAAPVAGSAKEGGPAASKPAPVLLDPSAVPVPGLTPVTADRDAAAEADRAGRDAEAVAMAVSEVRGAVGVVEAVGSRAAGADGASALVAAWRSTMTLVA